MNLTKEKTETPNSQQPNDFQTKLKNLTGNFFINVGQTILDTPSVPNLDNLVLNSTINSLQDMTRGLPRLQKDFANLNLSQLPSQQTDKKIAINLRKSNRTLPGKQNHQ